MPSPKIGPCESVGSLGLATPILRLLTNGFSLRLRLKVVLHLEVLAAGTAN